MERLHGWLTDALERMEGLGNSRPKISGYLVANVNTNDVFKSISAFIDAM
jgi:hypothetical protein